MEPNKYLKNQQPVEIVVILDRSGSMDRIRNDAIGGFNAFVEEQQKVPGEANLTLVLFDNLYDVVIDSKPIQEVALLTRDTFVPRGNTALYDAIGRTLVKLELTNPEKAIICILTDGQENSSKEYVREQIKEKITAAEARGWQVQYLAANQDAFAVGAALGSVNNKNFTADAAGTRSAYSNASASTTSYRVS